MDIPGVSQWHDGMELLLLDFHLGHDVGNLYGHQVGYQLHGYDYHVA
jgi:hypothetical protein